MCVCVCVCSGIFVDMENGTNNTRFGVATNHWEIMRCDWLPTSTDFIILIKTCIKTRSGTRDGFGDLVMCGEGVRHPTTSVHRWLPPSMCSCVCLINQAKMLDYYYPGVVGHTSIGDAHIRRGRFCFSLFPF